MTPMEMELLKTAWPWIWSAMLAGAGLYLRSLNGQLTKICDSLRDFSKDVARIEKEMAEDRASTRHRLDRLVGEADTRITRIEAVCEAQHGISMNRRAGDAKTINWAHDSDISGDKLR